MAKLVSIGGVGLDDLFRDKDGQIYCVLAITDRPTVTLGHINNRDHVKRLVIGSPLFRELQQLKPITDQQEERP